MLRDEFILFDTFKNVNLIGLVMSMFVGCLGKGSFWASWMKTSWVTKKNLKFCYLVTLILIILGFGIAQQMRSVKDIMIKYKPSHQNKGW